MQGKKGFTLLEILIVVLISASVLAFALPAQRRAQDRNRYLAAQGVLLDIGSAVQAKRVDMKMDPNTSESATFPNPNVVTPVTGSATFGENYIQPIPLEMPNHTYKNYAFYICPQDVGANARCCGDDAKYIACMKDAGACSRASEGLYAGARFTRAGTIEQISDTCPNR